jgi:hypothetical protein
MYYSAPQTLVGSGGGILNHASHFSLDMRNGVMMDNSNNVTVNIGSDQQAQGKPSACLNLSPIDVT